MHTDLRPGSISHPRRPSAVRSSIRVLLAGLAAATTLAATMVAGGNVSATAATDAASVSAAPMALSVMSYNIRHGQAIDSGETPGTFDLDRTAQVIAASGAGIVALQEVDRHYSSRSNNLDEPAYLAAKLHMYSAFGANLDLPPSTSGGPRRQYGTLILSKYPITYRTNILLPNPKNAEQRGLLEAYVNFRGTAVRVLCTHLDATGDQTARNQQTARINQLIGPTTVPTVLMGDMNTTANTTAYFTLRQKFSDAWLLAGRGNGYTIPSDTPTARIDYILMRSAVRATSVTVTATTASDHRPVNGQLVIG